MDNHETFKIPDSILLKESRKEVGQLKSEIDHLNHIIADKDNIIKTQKEKLEAKDKLVLSSEEKKAIRQGILYESMKTQIKSLNDKVRKLKREKEDLQLKLINNVFN